MPLPIPRLRHLLRAIYDRIVCAVMAARGER